MRLGSVRTALQSIASVCLPALAAATASAQGNIPRCSGPLPFAVGEGNRIAARDMEKFVAGKTFEYVRRHELAGQGRAPARTVERVFSLEFRRDGSLFSTCEERFEQAAPFKRCARMTQNVEGSSDGGVWRVADSLLCWNQTRIRDGEEVCVSVHRQEGRYAAKLVRGAWTCLEGEFLVK